MHTIWTTSQRQTLVTGGRPVLSVHREKEALAECECEGAMEVPFDLTQIFPAEMQRLDGTHLRKLTPRRCWAVQKLIDQMGALSAQAQGLKRVLTTYEKVADSDDDQVLYLLWHKSEKKQNSSVIIGMLKIGRKKLYLNDNEMRMHQLRPVCILDFYVHNTLQRRGHGHRIYDFMLQSEGVNAGDCAIDKPSVSLLNFMKKHYALTEPIWQNTNFVVYPSFFERLHSADNSPTKDTYIAVDQSQMSDKSRPIAQEQNGVHCYSADSLLATKTPLGGAETPEIERFHRAGRDSAARIIRGTPGQQPIQRPKAPPDTPQGRKNTRDFGHINIF